jgi:hypothetical protein
VAAVSHPYNTSFVELSDGTVVHPNYEHDIGFSTKTYLSLERRAELVDEQLEIHTSDSRLLLDMLEKFDQTAGHPLESRLLMDRVGAFGFSFGGAVAAELAKLDSRVRSALELDGVFHGTVAADGLEKPLLLIDAPWLVNPLGEEHDWLGGAVDSSISWSEQANRETRQRWTEISEKKMEVLARSGGLRAVVEGTGHFDFTDQIFLSPLRRLSCAGPIAPVRAAEIIRAYSLAFFQQTLLDIQSPLLKPDANIFSEVSLQVWKSE